MLPGLLVKIHLGRVPPCQASSVKPHSRKPSSNFSSLSFPVHSCNSHGTAL